MRYFGDALPEDFFDDCSHAQSDDPDALRDAKPVLAGSTASRPSWVQPRACGRYSCCGAQRRVLPGVRPARPHTRRRRTYLLPGSSLGEGDRVILTVIGLIGGALASARQRGRGRFEFGRRSTRGRAASPRRRRDHRPGQAALTHSLTTISIAAPLRARMQIESGRSETSAKHLGLLREAAAAVHRTIATIRRSEGATPPVRRSRPRVFAGVREPLS